jgi:hypothetical protein
MRYVIIRDDDTSALTPVPCLERLYRPFLDRGFPVNLATIPFVSTNTRIPDGSREGFLMRAGDGGPVHIPISANSELLEYLRGNPGFHLAQHGLSHDYLEFDTLGYQEACDRAERGTQLLMEAGFARPAAFVAPYDKISRGSYRALAERFSVISTGWFELGRVPPGWLPRYAWKKLTRASHWRVGRTRLLSHPGCLLSCYRQLDTILPAIRDCITRQNLTVLVTHWWEYFRHGQENQPFIDVLHSVARLLAAEPDLKVISFGELGRFEISEEAFSKCVSGPAPNSPHHLVSAGR